MRIFKEKLRVSRMVVEIVPYRRCVGYLVAKQFLNRRWPYGGEVEKDYDELNP